MYSIKFLICLSLLYVAVTTIFQSFNLSQASMLDDAQYSDCYRIAAPEIRKICLRLMSPTYNPIIETGTVRGTRSSEPVTLQSILASDGLGDLGKIEAFNQFLTKEDLSFAGSPGFTRFTDDYNLGRWQPMRGKRSQELGGK